MKSSPVSTASSSTNPSPVPPKHKLYPSPSAKIQDNQPDNAELIMTAATALTSLTRQNMGSGQTQGGHPHSRSESRDPHETFHSHPGQGRPQSQSQSQAPTSVQVLPKPPGQSIPSLMNMNEPPQPQPQRKGQRQKATRFPVKLMQILTAGQYEHIISWTPDGLSFVVKKPSQLVTDVLPYHFKEVKYSSFTRKLHRWGFVKILRGKELSAYFHKNFRRGDYDLCTQMHCSKTGVNHVARVSNSNQGSGLRPKQGEMDAVYQQRQQQQQNLQQRQQHQHPSVPQQSMTNMQGMPNHGRFYNGPPMPRQPMANRPPMQYMPQAPYGVNPMSCMPNQRFEMMGMPRNMNMNEHKRIMENAWNALSWESRSRAPQGKNVNVNMHLSPGP